MGLRMRYQLIAVLGIRFFVCDGCETVYADVARPPQCDSCEDDSITEIGQEIQAATYFTGR